MEDTIKYDFKTKIANITDLATKALGKVKIDSKTLPVEEPKDAEAKEVKTSDTTAAQAMESACLAVKVSKCNKIQESQKASLKVEDPINEDASLKNGDKVAYKDALYTITDMKKDDAGDYLLVLTSCADNKPLEELVNPENVSKVANEESTDQVEDATELDAEEVEETKEETVEEETQTEVSESIKNITLEDLK